jgi:hypothetical protein
MLIGDSSLIRDTAFARTRNARRKPCHGISMVAGRGGGGRQGRTNRQFSLLVALNRPGSAPMGLIAKLQAMGRMTLTGAQSRLDRRPTYPVARPDEAEKAFAACGAHLMGVIASDDAR